MAKRPTAVPAPTEKRFGWRPTPPTVRRLWIEDYLTHAGRARLVMPPESADWTEIGVPWGMMANDRLGDCVVACAGHQTQVFTRFGASQVVTPPDSEIVARYKRWCGPGDNGCYLPQVTEGWHRDGLGGLKLSAAAQFPGRRLELAKICIHEFGGIFAAACLPRSALEEFDRGEDWTDTSGPEDHGLGHGFPVVAYGREGVQIVTWGRQIGASWEWFAKYCGRGSGECWVLLHPAWSSSGTTPSGFDLAALQKDFADMASPNPPMPEPPAPPPEPPTPPPTPPVEGEATWTFCDEEGRAWRLLATGPIDHITSPPVAGIRHGARSPALRSHLTDAVLDLLYRRAPGDWRNWLEALLALAPDVAAIILRILEALRADPKWVREGTSGPTARPGAPTRDLGAAAGELAGAAGELPELHHAPAGEAPEVKGPMFPAGAAPAEGKVPKRNPGHGR